MSEMAEDFAALSKMQQAKKAQNRDVSAANLTRAGIPYASRNLGAHLIINTAGQTIDFWPGTGLWIARSGQPVKKRGVFKLIAYVKQLTKDQPCATPTTL